MTTPTNSPSTATESTNAIRLKQARIEPLEMRIAPATVLPGNYNFEEQPDFDDWTVFAGPGTSLTEYQSEAAVIRGGIAPEGDAYAHLSFEGRGTIGGTGFGPSLRSVTFTAMKDDVISVDWRATDGVDTAHPRGRLFTADGTQVGVFFDLDSGTTAFQTAMLTVPSDGDYYLLFEVGSSDVSVGGLVGASLDIDAIHRIPVGQQIMETPTPGGGVTVEISGGTAISNTFLVTLDDTGNYAQVFVNGALNYVQLLSSIDLLTIVGGTLSDELIVDSSRGLVTVSGGIIFDGGGSADTLQLTQTAGPVRDGETYTVGPGAGQGTIQIFGGGDAQSVTFENLEPVFDNVPSAGLTVVATDTANNIQITAGAGGGIFSGATGLIAVDSFVMIEFNNKASLTVEGRQGDDAFSIGSAFSPLGLTGNVLVVGGTSVSPFGDTLQYADAGAIIPAAAGVGSIIAAGRPSVGFAGIEATLVNGYTLTPSGPAFDAIVFGSAGDDDIVVGTNATTRYVTVQLNGLIGLFAGQGAIARVLLDGAGGSDSLAINGTADADTFIHQPASATAGNAGISGAVSVDYTAIASLTLNGLGSDDIFNLTATAGSVTVNGGPGINRIRVTGTDADDTFILTPSSPAVGSVAVLNGASIAYTSVDTVILDALDGGDIFKLDGVAGKVRIIGGTGADLVDFANAASGVTFDLDAIGTAQTVIIGGQEVSIEDAIENFTGSAFNDVLYADAAPFPRSLHGGPNTSEVYPPGDTLYFDGKGQVVRTTLTDWNTGVYRTTGFADTTFDEFESPIITNSPSGPGFGSPVNNTAFAAPQAYPIPSVLPSGDLDTDFRPRAVELADLNGDGFPDMIVLDPLKARINVLLNLGDGTFGLPTRFKTRGKAPSDLIVGEFNGLPGLDLAIPNRGTNTLAILAGDGLGGFAKATLKKTKATPSALALADMNGDGTDDIVIAHSSIKRVSVLLGTGTGFARAIIAKPGGKQTTDVIAADFDGDGKTDIVTANQRTDTISFLKGDGTGALAAGVQFATGDRPFDLTAADFNLDGVMDVAVANRTNKFASVLFSNGTVADPATQFASQLQLPLLPESAFTSIVAADFNGDGHADLGLGSLLNPSFTVLLGGNFGTFSQPYNFAIGNLPGVPKRGLAIADLNGDGLLDIVSASRKPLQALVLLRSFQIIP